MIPIISLVNDSSVCYLNSLLQCLMSCEKFNQDLQNGSDEINAYIALLNGIKEHFERLQKPFKVNPTGFKKVLFKDSTFTRGRQEDADETLVYFLDKIGNDNNKYFKNVIRTYTKCLACNHNNYRDEETYQLYLNIPYEGSISNITVHDCLNNYIKPESLGGYKCDSCGQANETKKALLPIQFGDNIVFVIKQYQRSHRRIPLKTLEEIDLGSYLFDKSNKKQNVPKKYKLNGAIIHHGGMGGGHYQAICKKKGFSQANDFNWFLFDDEHIEKIDDLKPVNGAYMMFYERS